MIAGRRRETRGHRSIREVQSASRDEALIPPHAGGRRTSGSRAEHASAAGATAVSRTDRYRWRSVWYPDPGRQGAAARWGRNAVQRRVPLRRQYRRLRQLAQPPLLEPGSRCDNGRQGLLSTTSCTARSRHPRRPAGPAPAQSDRCREARRARRRHSETRFAGSDAGDAGALDGDHERGGDHRRSRRGADSGHDRPGHSPGDGGCRGDRRNLGRRFQPEVAAPGADRGDREDPGDPGDPRPPEGVAPGSAALCVAALSGRPAERRGPWLDSRARRRNAPKQVRLLWPGARASR